MGYGSDAYGTSSYGTGAAPALAQFSVVQLEAVATRVLQVTFSAAALAQSDVVAGDALNPKSWIISRPDTGQLFTVAQVTKISSTVFQITVLEPFGPAIVIHQLILSVLNTSGTYYLNAPYFFSGAVAAAVATSDALAGSRGYAPIDIANRSGFGGASGTLIVTANGDYATVTGVELVRKLILRRLSTMPGGFFHLPDYGLGLQAKEPINVGALTRLKAEIERQVAEEPEVDSVQAGLLGSTDGTLQVTLRVKLKTTGQSISVQYPDQVSGNVGL